MKTIGLLGGMSWQSTAGYYRAINEGIRDRLGGLHSAQIAMVSVDFHEVEKLQHEGNWGATAMILASAAKNIEAAGADCLLICTNTMHKVADKIEPAITIPLLHIADATAKELLASKVNRVGLLGTSFTMEQDFYKGRLTDKYGLDVLIPSAEDRAIVHRVIYQELCLGNILPSSQKDYLRIIDNLAEQGAQAVILGCTEIGLLVNQTDTSIQLFDTTKIHAQAAVDFAVKC